MNLVFYYDHVINHDRDLISEIDSNYVSREKAMVHATTNKLYNLIGKDFTFGFHSIYGRVYFLIFNFDEDLETLLKLTFFHNSPFERPLCIDNSTLFKLRDKKYRFRNGKIFRIVDNGSISTRPSVFHRSENDFLKVESYNEAK